MYIYILVYILVLYTYIKYSLCGNDINQCLRYTPGRPLCKSCQPATSDSFISLSNSNKDVLHGTQNGAHTSYIRPPLCREYWRIISQFGVQSNYESAFELTTIITQNSLRRACSVIPVPVPVCRLSPAAVTELASIS